MNGADHFRRNLRAADHADRGFTLLSWLLGLGALALPMGIIGFLLVRGARVLSPAFLTDGPAGFPLGLAGGIRPALEGSVALMAIGLAIAVPLGVGGAIYLTEYARSQRFVAAFRFAAECLAGIPSIVYGLFGYAFLVVFMALRVSLLAGGITLGLMMFPIILIGAQESMAAVAWRYREAALALGVSRAYVIRRVILVKALPGILSVTVLAAGHALGSAAPVLYTASVIFVRGGLDWQAPVMTLPTHLYYLVGEAVSFDHAYGTALVLVALLLIINVTAMGLKWLGRS